MVHIKPSTDMRKLDSSSSSKSNRSADSADVTHKSNSTSKVKKAKCKLDKSVEGVIKLDKTNTEKVESDIAQEIGVDDHNKVRTDEDNTNKEDESKDVFVFKDDDDPITSLPHISQKKQLKQLPLNFEGSISHNSLNFEGSIAHNNLTTIAAAAEYTERMHQVYGDRAHLLISAQCNGKLASTQMSNLPTLDHLRLSPNDPLNKQDKSPQSLNDSDSQTINTDASDPLSLKCTKCHRVLKSLKTLSKHKLSCTVNLEALAAVPRKSKKPFYCNQCDFKSSRKLAVAQHMETEHDLFKCLRVRCMFVGETKDSLHTHLLNMHKANLPDAGIQYCKKCSQHVHTDVQPFEAHVVECRGKALFACKQCNKEFAYKFAYTNHMNSHFPDKKKKFACSRCDYSSNFKANLQKHIQCIHEQRNRDVTCPQCGKTFFTDESMKRHLKLHSDVRPFLCEVCKKKFKTRMSLKEHEMIHIEGRPFVCSHEGCDKNFRSSKFLKRHQIEMHKLEPTKFLCDHDNCGMSFFKHCQLIKHQKTYTDSQIDLGDAVDRDSSSLVSNESPHIDSNVSSSVENEGLLDIKADSSAIKNDGEPSGPEISFSNDNGALDDDVARKCSTVESSASICENIKDSESADEKPLIPIQKKKSCKKSKESTKKLLANEKESIKTKTKPIKGKTVKGEKKLKGQKQKLESQISKNVAYKPQDLPDPVLEKSDTNLKPKGKKRGRKRKSDEWITSGDADSLQVSTSIDRIQSDESPKKKKFTENTVVSDQNGFFAESNLSNEVKTVPGDNGDTPAVEDDDINRESRQEALSDQNAHLTGIDDLTNNEIKEIDYDDDDDDAKTIDAISDNASDVNSVDDVPDTPPRAPRMPDVVDSEDEILEPEMAEQEVESKNDISSNVEYMTMSDDIPVDVIGPNQNYQRVIKSETPVLTNLPPESSVCDIQRSLSKDYLDECLEDIASMEQKASTQKRSHSEFPDTSNNSEVSSSIDASTEVSSVNDHQPIQRGGLSKPIQHLYETEEQPVKALDQLYSSKNEPSINEPTSIQRSSLVATVPPTPLSVPPADMFAYQRMNMLSNPQLPGIDPYSSKDNSLQCLTNITYQNFGGLNMPTASTYLRSSDNMFARSPVAAVASYMGVSESDSVTPLIRSGGAPTYPSTFALTQNSPYFRTAASGGTDLFSHDMFGCGIPRSSFPHPSHPWTNQDIHATSWNQNPYFSSRQPMNTGSSLLANDKYIFERNYQFDPSCRPLQDQNFLSASEVQPRELSHDPFAFERFDLAPYFAPHPYAAAASSLDYSRNSNYSTNSKVFDDRLRQTSSVLPQPQQPSSSNVLCGFNMNPSPFSNLYKDMYAARDSMYHRPNPPSASSFLSHANSNSGQSAYFDARRSLYPQTNPYSFIDECQYAAAAGKLTHAAVPGTHEPFMSRRPANVDHQMDDPYRRQMLYGGMNRYI